MKASSWTVQQIREGWVYLRNSAYVYAVPLRSLSRVVRPGDEVDVDEEIFSPDPARSTDPIH